MPWKNSDVVFPFFLNFCYFVFAISGFAIDQLLFTPNYSYESLNLTVGDSSSITWAPWLALRWQEDEIGHRLELNSFV